MSMIRKSENRYRFLADETLNIALISRQFDYSKPWMAARFLESSVGRCLRTRHICLYIMPCSFEGTSTSRLLERA